MKKLILFVMVLTACSRGKAGDDGLPGPGGPAGEDLSSAPRIDSISPAVGSLRNTILVTGSNFSASAVDLEVRIGGVLASLLEATPTSLRIIPPLELPLGPAPVMVTRGTKSSATVAFTVVESGTQLETPIAVVKRPGEPIDLIGGKILVTDRDDKAIVEIDAAGVARTLASGGGLADPRRLLLRGDGSVLVFDAVAPALFRLDPATGELTVERWGTSYIAGSLDAGGNLYALRENGLDRIAPDGTKIDDWATLPAGTTGVDVQVIGTSVFVAVEGTVTAIAKYDTAMGGVGVVLPSVGVNELRGIAADGAALVASGDFTATGGEGLATIDGTTGAVTAVTTDPLPFGEISGAIRQQTGDYVIADLTGGWVGRRTATSLDVLSGVGSGIDHVIAAGGATWAVVENGDPKPGWILELRADGTSRIVTRGRFGQIAPGADSTKLLVTRLEQEDVAEILIATGAATSVLDVSAEMAEPVGYARDAGGFQYVASTVDGEIAKYDAAGALQAGWPIAAPGASHLRVDGAYLYVTQPGLGALKRAFLADGTLSAVFDGSAGLVSPRTTFRDTGVLGDGVLYVTDPDGGWLYFLDGDAHGSVAPHVPIAAGALMQRGDGMLVAGGGFGLRLITP